MSVSSPIDSQTLLHDTHFDVIFLHFLEVGFNVLSFPSSMLRTRKGVGMFFQRERFHADTLLDSHNHVHSLQTEDANGNVPSIRTSYQPVSWYTFATIAFGSPFHTKVMGEHFGEDPAAEVKSGMYTRRKLA